MRRLKDMTCVRVNMHAEWLIKWENEALHFLHTDIVSFVMKGALDVGRGSDLKVIINVDLATEIDADVIDRAEAAARSIEAWWLFAKELQESVSGRRVMALLEVELHVGDTQPNV